MIIKKNNVVVELTCPKCGSVLGVEKSDIRYHYHFGHASYHYFNCSACDSRIRVSTDVFPKSWGPYLHELLKDAMGDDFLDY